ncbi:MAG: glycosyltransferase [Bdellovibrionales bacterium]|nr:glycosyltransferase [Bdellovibrionales bacterium]
MNYLIVHKDHPLDVAGVNSGAEMATLSLARFLARRGHSVIVGAQLKGPAKGFEGVRFIDLGDDYNCERALDEVRKQGDYVLISAGRAQVFFLAKGDPQCLTRILISHDRAENDTGIRASVLLTLVDQIVCVSHAQAGIFREAGVPDDRLKVIHNGTDLDLFTAGDPDSRDWMKLVFSGALVQDKGLDLLLVSFAELKQEFPHLTLDVFGSAGLWGRSEIYNTQELEAGLPGVSFHGKVSQKVIAQAFRDSGICVVPSRWFDPFPLTAIEAQVSGCPVVTFNVGGLQEGVVDGKTGVVLPEVCQESLTRAIRDLLAHPERLREMSKNALQVQREYFTWERVAKEIEQLCCTPGEKANTVRIGKRIGLMSTWNQPCGLASHARYLFEQFQVSEWQVFSERTDRLIRPDEDFVHRCWSKSDRNFDELVATVRESGVEILHINVHSLETFESEEFSRTLKRLRECGVRILLHLHSTFSSVRNSAIVLEQADAIVVHFEQAAIELVEKGASPERIRVIPLGVQKFPKISLQEKAHVRDQFGISSEQKIISSAGFIQRHKGMEAVVEAVARLREQGEEVVGILMGSPNDSDDQSLVYLDELREYVDKLGVHEHIHFKIGYVEDDELISLFQVSDLVVMNYRSEHFEASGSCTQAIGAGALVATSFAPPFAHFGNAVWPISREYPVSRIAQCLFQNDRAAENLRENGRRFSQKYSWGRIGREFQALYRSLEIKNVSGQTDQISTKGKEPNVKKGGESSNSSQNPGASYRVLIQNRSNMYTHPGGDTVLVDQTKAALETLGVQVDIDLSLSADVSQYDIVHAINFALPQLVRTITENAKKNGVPCVVTTLCEDIGLFHNQSIVFAEELISYVQRGQDISAWQAVQTRLSSVPQCAPFDNSWTAANADALIVNGENERFTIKRLYPGAVECKIVPVGYEIKTGESGADLFASQYGVRDFILCVGRLESRKNQLMLLKALEDVELDIVFVGGGVNYQPQYADAVRAFQRKGKTLVLDRLSDEELVSAYSAAKVHALPSWYELPGLVSLEAASFGCNVVVTENGTARDYFGKDAFYCSPSDEGSIRNAVLAAYYSPVVANLSSRVQAFSWKRAGEATLEVYQQFAKRSHNAKIAEVPGESRQVQIPQEYFSTLSSSDFERLLEEGQQAAREKQFEKAQALLSQAENLQPNSVRCLRNRAAIFMACSDLENASRYFERAYALDSRDAKTLSGLGMCSLMRQEPAHAFPYFLSALEQDPYEMVALLQLLDCSYRLGRFEELESALRRYLDRKPEDMEMTYCLAGCLFRQGKLTESKEWSDRVLQKQPLHRGASELREKLQEAAQEKDVGPTPLAAQIDSAIDRLMVNTPPRDPLSVQVSNEPTAPTATKARQMPFDTIDTRLLELEDMKHKKEYSSVSEGCENLLSRNHLSEHQIKKAELLLAEVWAMTGETGKASALFEKWHSREPNCARSLCGLAAISASSGDWECAQELFARARSSEPSHDVSYAGLALCASQRKSYDEAWDLNVEALKRNPENTTALLGVIQLGHQLKKLGALEGYLSEYLDMHPADLQFIYAYAGCLYAQERVDEARSEVEKILLFKPEHEHARELQQMIQEKASESAVSLR